LTATVPAFTGRPSADETAAIVASSINSLGAGEILRPADRLDIIGEILCALGQIGEVPIGQVDALAPHVLLGALDEVAADRVADAARAGMQHHPDPVGLVEAELDKVIAGAQGAEMGAGALGGARQFRVLVGDDRELRGQRRHRRPRQKRLRRAPRAAVVPAAAIGAAVRHGLLDCGAHPAEVVGQVGGGEIGHCRDHAAADIDPDRGRHDRALCGYNRADGRALAPMHVGHYREVLIDEGQGGDIAQLLFRLLLDRDAAGPGLDRDLLGLDGFV
jgi:hypothetical protein